MRRHHIEWISHTGDMAFAVEAPDWPALLAAATAALGEVLCEREGRPEEVLEGRPVSVEGGSREDVLVAWLTEAIVRFEDERFVPRDAEFAHAGARGAQGILRGRSLAAGEAPDRVVKAATYHDLHVDAGRGERPWRATVVLDL